MRERRMQIYQVTNTKHRENLANTTIFNNAEFHTQASEKTQTLST